MEESRLGRRGFLSGCAGATAGVALGVSSRSLSAAAGSEVETFARLRGRRFRARSIDVLSGPAQGASTSAGLELVDVTVHPWKGGARPAGVRAEPFSLLFRGPSSLEAGRFLVKPAGLESFVLSMTPVGPRPGEYEAVFS